MNTSAAKFAAAIIASILSIANAAAQTGSTEPAPSADTCLTTPREYTPPGTRWRYRIERSSGRHCWFLKDEVEKSSNKTAERQSATAEETAPQSPRKKQAAPRSVSDARADSRRPADQNERPAPVDTAPATAASASPADAAQPPANSTVNVLAPASAARWANPTSAAPPATVAANPAPPQAEQTAEASATQPPAKAPVMPRVVPPAPLSEKPMSWPMLITIIAGGFSVFAVLVSMLLALIKSRKARRAPKASMPAPLLPGQQRRPGDLYRTRKQWREMKSGRRAA